MSYTYDPNHELMQFGKVSTILLELADATGRTAPGFIDEVRADAEAMPDEFLAATCLITAEQSRAGELGDEQERDIAAISAAAAGEEMARRYRLGTLAQAIVDAAGQPGGAEILEEYIKSPTSIAAISEWSKGFAAKHGVAVH